MRYLLFTLLFASCASTLDIAPTQLKVPDYICQPVIEAYKWRAENVVSTVKTEDSSILSAELTIVDWVCESATSAKVVTRSHLRVMIQGKCVESSMLSNISVRVHRDTIEVRPDSDPLRIETLHPCTRSE